MAREFQLIGYLRLLAAQGVDYLLVGRVGARIQGTATTTQDIDIMPEPSVQNLDRLAQALSDDQTEKKESGETSYRSHPVVDSIEFRTSAVSSFRTRFGVIDVLMELPGERAAVSMAGRHHHVEGDGRPREGSPCARRVVRSTRLLTRAPRSVRTRGAGSESEGEIDES
jgi:hypothetical protein